MTELMLQIKEMEYSLNGVEIISHILKNGNTVLEIISDGLKTRLWKAKLKPSDENIREYFRPQALETESTIVEKVY